MKRKRGDSDLAVPGHDPALLPQVVSSLRPANGESYLDLTFGGGGISRAVLEAADCRVFAIDRDPEAEPRTEEMRKEFGDRFGFMRARFTDYEKLLKAREWKFPAFDGVILDAGTSSFQLDDPSRGFSLYIDGPLDMRMDAVPEKDENGRWKIEGAAKIVNFAGEQELADIIYRNSDERYSRHSGSPCSLSLHCGFANIMYDSFSRQKNSRSPPNRTHHIHLDPRLPRCLLAPPFYPKQRPRRDLPACRNPYFSGAESRCEL